MNMRRISSFVLAVLMVLSMASTVFAADASLTFTSLDGGLVLDAQPGSVYTETDLFDNFKNVMPGDTLSQKITITNDIDECDYIKVYMRAYAHDEEGNPLSENVAATGETVATMTDFLAQLSMKIYHGEALIYEASPDELDGLAENVLLGEFRQGESTELRVELVVPIELGNEYASRVGEVDWLFTVEGFDDPEPEEDTTWLTVHKNWVGVGPHPLSVKVHLLKDGRIVDTKLLTPLTQWTWTWGDLEKGHIWTVMEVVPEGYVPTYTVLGNVVIITNFEIPPEPTEPDPTEPEPTDPLPTKPEPTEPLPTEPQPTEPDPTDPEPSEPMPTEPQPTEPEPTEPQPTEPEPTESEPTEPEPAEPVDLTVKKEWKGDEATIKDRPESVKVTLFNGTEAIESVVLGSWNNWTYTWKDLDGNGDWSVLEVNIPKGYTPSYKVNGETVTITNTATLIQTGQLNWPILVLGGLGLVMLSFGAVMMLKKRKEEDA